MSQKLHTLTAIELRALMRAAEVDGFGRGVRQKLNWFLFAVEHERNVSLTCRHFAITRGTFVRWLERFDGKNLSTLEECSRRPHRTRAPQTESHVIEWIRAYRQANPMLGKEAIRKLLWEEHGVLLSASSVGRVIARHKFFFGDTEAHRRKLESSLLGMSDDDGTENDDVTTGPPDEPPADGGPSLWLKPGLTVVVALLTAFAFGGFSTERAHAEQSASYSLESDSFNEGAAMNGQSQGYQMDGGITWYQAGLTGPSYSIVSDPGVSSSSSPASSTSSASSSSQSQQSTGGGHHSAASSANVSSSTATSSRSSAASSRSSVSSQHSQASSRASSALPSSAASSTGMASSSMSSARQSSASSGYAQSAAPIGTPGGLFGPQTAPGCQSCFFTGGNYRPLQASSSSRRSSSSSSAHYAAPVPASPGWFSTSVKIVSLMSLSALTTGLGTLIVRWLVANEARNALFFLFFGEWLSERKKKKKMTVKRKRAATGRRKKATSKAKRAAVSVLLVAFACGAVGVLPPRESAYAANVPSTYIYKGHLLTSAGAAVTTNHNVRFSFWRTTDYQTGDVSGTGAIATGSAGYVGWQETHSVTPDSRGYFTVELGSVNPLLSLSNMSASDLLSLYLQVEVKPASSSDTSYELLDVDPADTARDRAKLLSVPFAQDAAMVDQHSVGTGSGSIPLLVNGGLLPKAFIPGGTNVDFFTVDADDSATEVRVNFGTTLGKSLTYDKVATEFRFNDDVRVQGNLTVTGSLTVNGLINGVDITTLSSTAIQPLMVSSGAGLKANIAQGNYRINGGVTNYAGGSNVSLNANTDNYLFFTSTGLTVTTLGFPNDKSYIPLAKVTTNGSGVQSVTDMRVLQTDDRQSVVQRVLHAAYEGAAYQGDGSDNVGQLMQAADQINLQNYYMWTSSKSALQDYDVLVYVSLPLDFKRWQDGITVGYRSTSANAADNKLDIQVYDTNGSPVTLTGTSQGLLGTSWSTTALQPGGSPTWTPGQKFMIRLKLYSANSYQMQIGDIKLHYVELQH